MPAYNWAGDVAWAGPVTWALGAGETLPVEPDIGWPTEPIGPSHTLFVPSFGGRSELFRPKLFVGDRDIYAINFGPECLEPMGDEADELLGVTASSPALIVQTRTPVGSAVEGGIVQVAVAGAAPAGVHTVRVRISTLGGREISALFSVIVLSA